MDLSGIYYSLGANLGYKFNAGLFDINSRLGYDFAYLESDSYEDPFFGTFNYPNAKSNRARFDITTTYLANDKFRPYFRAIAEYEFNGDNEVAIYSDKFSVGDDGFSVGAGLGFVYQPVNSTTIELGASQLFGEREETNAKLGVTFNF